MALNWTNIGNVFGGLTSALTSAGISGSALSGILQQIGFLSNPSESEELGLCKQILIVSGNPALVGGLAMKLATENGIPPAAASLATTLMTPGVEIPARVMQIEAIIKAGG
jgi:hypothetical protein